MIVYLVRDIPAFVMYCIYGVFRSSLLIESTDSMIYDMRIHFTYIGSKCTFVQSPDSAMLSMNPCFVLNFMFFLHKIWTAYH